MITFSLFTFSFDYPWLWETFGSFQKVNSSLRTKEARTMSLVFEDNPNEDPSKYFVQLLLPNVRNAYLFIHLIIQQMYTDFDSLSRFHLDSGVNQKKSKDFCPL